VRNETFNDPKDLIQKAKHLIVNISESYKNIERDLPLLHNGSFIYLFQKFDEIYQQQTLKLKFIIGDKEEDATTQEKEAKKIIQELFRCEMAISNLIPDGDMFGNMIPYTLVSHLEVLYKDFDLLPELLLTIFLKFSNLHSKMRGEQSCINILNFMAPFLEFFNEQDWDIVDISKKKIYLDYLESIFKQNKEMLLNNMKVSEEKIHDFTQMLEQNKNNYQELRRIFWDLCHNKTTFKEEPMYYQMLGKISLVLYIKSLDERKEKFLVTFLKICVISYLWAGKQINLLF